MPAVFPFEAVQYRGPGGPGTGDLTAKIAPPYDVLDGDDRAALQERDERNVVGIDLPHVPPKQLGPPEAYEKAASLYRSWLEDGTLARHERPVMFAYRQRFEFMGRQYDRCGMACTVEVQPFGPREGGGMLAHEQTFSGPKEDRFALMKTAGAQFSPIFGLHADDSGAASGLVRKVIAARQPDATARSDDGVLHELWTIGDDETIQTYQAALKGEDVFVADGHHRYTTAINYLQSLEAEGDVPADHPARRCMIVMVGMSDPGLAIGPTHRVLGGMGDYSIEAFLKVAGDHFDINELGTDPKQLDNAIAKAGSKTDHNVLGLLDFASGRCFVATAKSPDPLADRFSDKSEAWRRLDVAVIQHLIVEELCQPKLNSGKEVTWAFPHTIDEVLEIGSGAETGAGGGAGFAQLAVIVRPTPLDSVRDVSKANELMPQKSTFFYPKLATGLFLNPLQR